MAIIKIMINRRNFFKTAFFAATFPAIKGFAATTMQNKKDTFIRQYGDSICPFCSIGCRLSILKNIYSDRVTIKKVWGNEKSFLNNGELCPKYLNLPFEKTLHHHKRIDTPLLKMKNGDFTPISWKQAFELMATKAKESIKSSGVNGVGLIVSERLSLYEAYAISKLYKAGFRSNNISSVHPEVEQTAQTLIQTFGIDGSNGSFEDIFESNCFVSYGIDWNKDFKIIEEKISFCKRKNGQNFRFINIFSNREMFYQKADINLQILPFSEPILLSFLINYSLQFFTKEDFEFLHSHTVFALLNKTKKVDDDRFDQWEVSLKEYKKHFAKFTLEYAIKKLKPRDENKEDFKSKLLFLAFAYKDSNQKILSYLMPKRYDIFTDINLYIDSLHLLTNKYTKKGSGVMRLHNETLTSTQNIPVGNTSRRLPMGQFIKYKQSRQRAETIWHIPNGTLNSIASSDPLIVFKNIEKNITKFVWCMGIEAKDFEYIEKNKKNNDEAFVVSSTLFSKDIPPFADLVLPTTTLFEKNIAFENSQRELSCFVQHSIPNNEAMSELWQILEFSKKLKIIDFWDTKFVGDNLVLKNLLPSMKHIDFLPKITIFTMLFHNKKARGYLLDEEKLNDIYYFNSEVKGDLRTIYDGDGAIFRGYNFFVQKYLFEEICLFGLGYGYDLDLFESYFYPNPPQWPVVFTEETPIRFDISQDPYGKKNQSKGKKYIFYGKFGKKQLPFGNNNTITKLDEKELKSRAKIFMIKRG